MWHARAGHHLSSGRHAPAEQFRTRPGNFSSICQSSYFAQPLNRQCVMRDLPCRVAHKNRSGIARPSPVGGPAMEAHLIEIRSGAREACWSPASASPCFQRSDARSRARQAGAQSRHRATESIEIFPASPQDYAAMQAMWLHAAPTPRACDSPVNAAHFRR